MNFGINYKSKMNSQKNEVQFFEDKDHNSEKDDDDGLDLNKSVHSNASLEEKQQDDDQKPQPEEKEKEQKEKPIQSHGLISSLKIIIHYLLSELKKKQRSFKIGMATVFIVVTFLTLIQSAIQLAPLMFLKLSENQMGDMDTVLTASSGANKTYANLPNLNTEIEEDEYIYPFINNTDISMMLGNAPEIVGVAPRWYGLGKMRNPENSLLNTSAIFLVVNSTQEINIGLGRSFPDLVIGKNEAIVSASGLRPIEINPDQGGSVELYIDVKELLSTAMNIDISNSNYMKELLLELVGNSTVTINPNDLLISSEELPEENPFSAYFTDDQWSSFVENYENFSDSNEDNLSETEVPLSDIIESFNFSEIPDEAYVLTKEFTILEAVEGTEGKWPKVYGNVMMIDDKYFLSFLIETLTNNINNLAEEDITFATIAMALASMLNSMSDINIEEYAMTSNIMFDDRVNLYTKSKMNRRYELLSRARKIVDELGIEYSVSFSFPLIVTLDEFELYLIFLEVLFLAVIFFLVILSMMLIYSLMISDIEEKTYEFGMLRALGLKQKSLIVMLFIQAIMYAIPGLCFGMVVCYLINVIVCYIIFDYTNAVTTFGLHWTAILLGVCIGTLMPIVSNIGPIARAFSKTLRDALDLYHHVISEITVRIVRLEKMGISLTEFVIAITLIVCGIMAFYLAPYAMVYGNMRLLLFVLDIILLCMILGLIILAQIFVPYLQKVVLWVITFLSIKDWNLHVCVKNNLKAHSRRNSKTSLMFAIALSFMVFAGCSFDNQKNMIVSMVKMLIGADLHAYVVDDDLGLNESELREYLDTLIQNTGYIEDYTFVSRVFKDMFPVKGSGNSNIENIVGPLCHTPNSKISVYGIEENYLNVAYNEFYYPNQIDDISLPDTYEGKEDAVAALYSDEGLGSYDDDYDYRGIIVQQGLYSIPPETGYPTVYENEIKMILPEGLKKAISVNVDTKAFTCTSFYSSGYYYCQNTYRVKIRAMATKFPGFYFSGYKQINGFATGLVSMDQYEDMMNEFLNLEDNEDYLEYYNENYKDLNITNGIPKDSLLVRLKPGLSDYERAVISNGIRSYFRNDLSQLLDCVDQEKTADDTLMILQIFFIIITVIAFVLSFFLLWISNISNIKENLWEFGVLRAIGLSKGQVSRVYIYESFSVTMAAVISGFIVGIIVSITLTLQINLFLELPFKFVFPTLIFCIMLGLSFITSFVGSYYPTLNINNHQVAEIIRGDV